MNNAAMIALVGLAVTMTGIADARPPASIIGTWAMKGDYCGSGAPVVFESGGRYRNAGGEFTGSWKLGPKTITLRVIPIDPTSGKTTGKPDIATVAFRQIGPNEIMIGADRLRRCPSRGGAEPWHPGQRFTTR